jgi:hypothetical protein
MKKVVTVSLGSSQQDFTFQTDFLGERFEISRLGADDDTTKAWELMRRHQASADAIGLGEIGDHYQVGQSTLVNKETRRLLKVVTRVPATTGATLRRLLQVRAVRQVQKELVHYFNNNLVLFFSGMRNYDMAVALSDYTKNLFFADALMQTGAPTMLTSIEQLELYARGKDWILGGRRGELLESALTGFKNMRLRSAIEKCHVVVGTFGELKAGVGSTSLAGKTVITSAVDDERLAWFKERKTNLVIDVSPNLFERVVGTNVIDRHDPGQAGQGTRRDLGRRLRRNHRGARPAAASAAPDGQVPQHQALRVRHPPLESDVHQEEPADAQVARPSSSWTRSKPLAAYMPPMVYCKMRTSSRPPAPRPKAG